MRDSERANRESPEGRLQKAAFDARPRKSQEAGGSPQGSRLF